MRLHNQPYHSMAASASPDHFSWQQVHVPSHGLSLPATLCGYDCASGLLTFGTSTPRAVARAI